MDRHGISRSHWEEDVRRLRVRLAVGGLFLVAVLILGIVGYWTIDPTVGVVDALYMTVITLTTVGFEEVVDLTGRPGGRIFTVVLILVGMGAALYFVSTATAFVLEGHLGNVFRMRRMEKAIERLSDHLIICGSSGTALYTTLELVSVQRDVVVVCENAEAAEALHGHLPETPLVVGDPASDEVLTEAGVARAAGLVACTESDKENLVITLSARQLNPSLRIVARVSDVEAEQKIRKVGADAVVSPDLIGGLRLASELIRPTVVSFLDIMLRDRDLNLRVDEVRLTEGSSGVGRKVAELNLHEYSNALLLALQDSDGGWTYNPPGERRLEAGHVLVLLGSPTDVLRVSEELDGEMVSKPSASRA